MIRNSIYRFLKSEDGPTAVEYAVMLMLVMAVAFVSIQLMGQALGDSLENSKDELESAMN